MLSSVAETLSLEVCGMAKETGGAIWLVFENKLDLKLVQCEIFL